MNEVLLKKIKYLLSFKFNSEEDMRYLPLLEKILYNFVIEMEEKYNKQVSKNAYYNFLLNNLNNNIKSIIIPSDTFFYHPLGFLELSTNLKPLLKKYNSMGIETTEELKQSILKRNYYYHLLQVVKSTRTTRGIVSTNPKYIDKFEVVTGCRTIENSTLYLLEKAFTMAQSLTLTNLIRLYKVKYKVVYPDGTSHVYFNYYKALDYENVEIMNIAKMLEVVIGDEKLMQISIEGNFGEIDKFNEKYDELLGNLRFDMNTKDREYNCLKFFSKYMAMIIEEENKMRKVEIIKVLNNLIFMMYEKKLLELLKNPLNKMQMNLISHDIKTLEECMLYNEEIKFHNQMSHVQLLKSIKDKFKIAMVKGGTSSKNIKEYTIYSRDKKKNRSVLSSLLPINFNNNIVTFEIHETSIYEGNTLVRFSTFVYNSDLRERYTYENLYLSVKDMKLLYDTSDLGVITKESEKIRKLIAERIVNPQIMELILNERASFLGEFVYNSNQDKGYILKNAKIVSMLKNQ